MASKVPQALRHHILPFDWDVRRVWRLDTPARPIPRAELDYLLDLPLWSSKPKSGMLFDLAPRAVLEDARAAPHQYRRVCEADTSYPIDMLEFDGARWILDGVHRLARLYLEGAEVVSLRLHPAEVVPLIRLRPGDAQ